MAKRICGEASLRVGARTVRLRLDIGTMMDLEDHFDMGLVPFLTDRLPQFRLRDLAVLFAAMTGGDFTDPIVQRKAGTQLVKAGLKEAAEAISTCLERTLQPQGDGLGKPGAGQQTPTMQTAQ